MSEGEERGEHSRSSANINKVKSKSTSGVKAKTAAAKISCRPSVWFGFESYARGAQANLQTVFASQHMRASNREGDGKNQSNKFNKYED